MQWVKFASLNQSINQLINTMGEICLSKSINQLIDVMIYPALGIFLTEKESLNRCKSKNWIVLYRPLEK